MIIVIATIIIVFLIIGFISPESIDAYCRSIDPFVSMMTLIH